MNWTNVNSNKGRYNLVNYGYGVTNNCMTWIINADGISDIWLSLIVTFN